MNQKIGILGVLLGLVGFILALIKFMFAFGATGQQVLFILLIITSLIALIIGVITLVSSGGNAEAKKIGLACLLLGLSSALMFYLVEAKIPVDTSKLTGAWVGKWVDEKSADTKLAFNDNGLCNYTVQGSGMTAPYKVENQQITLYPMGMVGTPPTWKIVSVDDKKMVLKIEDKDVTFKKE